VAAVLASKALGDRLQCIFVDNGLLRKNEFQEVLGNFRDHFKLNVIGVDARNDFMAALQGKTDPEDKRKAIGKTFIDVFERESKRFGNVTFLLQGTLYTDVIESVSVHGTSVTIKSHHNVGGLPEVMSLKLIEPLRELFKDEVRQLGQSSESPGISCGGIRSPALGLPSGSSAKSPPKSSVSCAKPMPFLSKSSGQLVSTKKSGKRSVSFCPSTPWASWATDAPMRT
jgi:GMP synthase (glutamine-hydrolysing)